jgi:hypothetical protein
MSIQDSFNIEIIKKQRDVSMYQYMCERNALRILLMGYNIEEPLLWMRCGLYLYDEDFFNNGCFSTLFSRPMLDTQALPILGDAREELAWDEIDIHLSKGLPVFISVDVFYMTYKRETYYHNSHGAHIVLLVKKSSDGYFVLDWYHPDYFYGNISKEELVLARTSQNEKDKMSVFSGFPINSSYRLLYMDRLPSCFNLEQCICNNLLLSIDYLVKSTGPLYFFEKAKTNIPDWVNIAGQIGYQNAIQSFFFFDLEIKLLIIYFEKIANSGLFLKLHPTILYNSVVEMHYTEELLKNKLLFAFRRNKTIELESWQKFLSQLIGQIKLYCENTLKFLKEFKG